MEQPLTKATKRHLAATRYEARVKAREPDDATPGRPVIAYALWGEVSRREIAFPTEMPVGLTEVFVAIAENRGLWSGFLRRNPPTLEPPPFADLQEELRRFFGPIIACLGTPEGANDHLGPDTGTWRQDQAPGNQ